jgi:beta-lactamase class D/beta-lactamase class D OXA-1
MFFEEEFRHREGCFVIKDMRSHALLELYGEERCRKRIAPQSTFKIPLVALAFKNKIFRTLDDRIVWDGTDHGSSSWNRDQTPVTYLKNSVIWVSRLIAARLGKETVERYLSDFHYGNEDASGYLGDFWLTNGTLKISAFEQIRFLAHLWSPSFDGKVSAAALARQALFRQEVGGYKVFGKTGSGCLSGSCEGPDARHYGWFVGVLEQGDCLYTFALNFEEKLATTGWAGPKAEQIVSRYVKRFGKDLQVKIGCRRRDAEQRHR